MERIDDTASRAKLKQLLVVVATNFDTLQVANSVNTNTNSNWTTADVTIFDEFLATRRDVDTAGISLPTIGTLNSLLDKHKQKCSSGFSLR